MVNYDLQRNANNVVGRVYVLMNRIEIVSERMVRGKSQQSEQKKVEFYKSAQ